MMTMMMMTCLGLQTVLTLLWIKSSQQLLRASVFIIYLLHSHPVCSWLLCSFVSWGTRRKSKEGMVVRECKWEIQCLLISSLKCYTCNAMNTSTDVSTTPSAFGLTRRESRKYHLKPAYICPALKYHSCDFIALKFFLRIAGERELLLIFKR